MVAGGVLPWFVSVDLISADERYGARSVFSTVGGAVVLVLALLGKAPIISGALTTLSGLVSGFVILSVVTETFITGPDYRIGIYLAVLGAAFAFVSGIWLSLGGTTQVSQSDR